MVAFKTEPSAGYWANQIKPHGDGYQSAVRGRKVFPFNQEPMLLWEVRTA
jgi:hypothetical protein